MAPFNETCMRIAGQKNEQLRIFCRFHSVLSISNCASPRRRWTVPPLPVVFRQLANDLRGYRLSRQMNISPVSFRYLMENTTVLFHKLITFANCDQFFISFKSGSCGQKSQPASNKYIQKTASVCFSLRPLGRRCPLFNVTSLPRRGWRAKETFPLSVECFCRRSSAHEPSPPLGQSFKPNLLPQLQLGKHSYWLGHLFV